MKVVLTIAGSDSGGGAGIQADLKTFESHGVFGVTVITAITAQNTREVRAVFEAPVEIVRQQLAAVFDDFPIAAVKIGMLSNRDIVECVTEGMARYAANIPVVVDPVMVSSTGRRLLGADAVDMLVERLMPRAAIITPNADEALILSGIVVIDLESMKLAAQIIVERGASAALLKGGHVNLEAGSAITDGIITDVLFDGRSFHEFTMPRIATAGKHGTGCTLSSAIAANLALGLTLVEAVAQAQEYVHGAIRYSPWFEQENGPLLHSWRNRLL